MKFQTFAKELLYEQFYKLPENLSFSEIKSRLGIKAFLNEATVCAPVCPKDISLFMELFNKPMPAGISVFMISDLLNDDSLNTELNAFANKDPYADARSIIVQWVSNNMPHIIPDGKFDNDEGYNSLLGSQEFH